MAFCLEICWSLLGNSNIIHCSVLIEMPSLKPLVLKKIFPTPNHYLHEGVIIERNVGSENL